MRSVLKVFVALLVVGGLGYAAWLGLRPRPTAASLRVQTVQAETTVMEDVLVVAGLVKPAITIELRAEASGLVESVSAKEGERVAAGQELVRLDSESRAVLTRPGRGEPPTGATAGRGHEARSRRGFRRAQETHARALEIAVRESASWPAISSRYASSSTASPCAASSAPTETSRAARPESSR